MRYYTSGTARVIYAVSIGVSLLIDHNTRHRFGGALFIMYDYNRYVTVSKKSSN